MPTIRSWVQILAGNTRTFRLQKSCVQLVSATPESSQKQSQQLLVMIFSTRVSFFWGRHTWQTLNFLRGLSMCVINSVVVDWEANGCLQLESDGPSSIWIWSDMDDPPRGTGCAVECSVHRIAQIQTGYIRSRQHKSEYEQSSYQQWPCMCSSAKVGAMGRRNITDSRRIKLCRGQIRSECN